MRGSIPTENECIISSIKQPSFIAWGAKVPRLREIPTISSFTTNGQGD